MGIRVKVGFKDSVGVQSGQNGQWEGKKLLGAFASIESDTWLTGYPRSQDPAPHKSVQ